jgi:hypothetical protein
MKDIDVCRFSTPESPDATMGDTIDHHHPSLEVLKSTDDGQCIYIDALDLMYAIKRRDIGTCEELIYARVNLDTCLYGDTPLSLAQEYGLPEIVSLIRLFS